MQGSAITIKRGKLKVPNDPIIPFIEGDGTGADIWAASVRVLDAAVEKAFKGKKKIVWKEVLAGEKAFNKTGSWLPDETLKVIDEYKLVVDPNDKVYQELSLRLFHFRNTQVAGFIEEIVKEFNVGSLIKPAAGPEIPFSGTAYPQVKKTN